MLSHSKPARLRYSGGHDFIVFIPPVTLRVSWILTEKLPMAVSKRIYHLPLSHQETKKSEAF